MSENVNQYSTRHPHEPAIPPAYDAEGRCLVCVLIVERDDALTALAQERELKAKLDKLVCDTLATRVKCEKELENARERNASLLKLLVESVIPYEALLADAESRKWIAPSIWGAMEECRDKVRALIGVSPSSRDAQGERT